MKIFSKLFVERNKSLILLTLILSTLSLRLYAFLFRMDITGDGPVRATIAYNWSKSPCLYTHGDWLPGFTYLTGIFSCVYDNPLFSVKLINLIAGTFTVIFFYVLILKIFDHATALLSALILAFFPLHIGLSASSLTEITFLFETIAAIVFLIKAVESNRRRYLILSFLFFGMAEMTRYEAWLLIPLLPSYYWWRTRKVSESILLAIVLIVLPFAWCIGNYSYYGNPFVGFTGAAIGAEAVGLSAIGIMGAIKIIWTKLFSHLGFFLSVSVIAGLLLEFYRLKIKKSIDANRFLYIAVFFVYWVVMFRFTIVRGYSLWDRYLLLVFVLSIPFSILPYVYFAKNNLRKLVVILFVAISTMGISFFLHAPEVCVTKEKPAAIQNIAVWLKSGSYSSDAVLMTRLDWKSTYLPLYFPEISSRHLIVSFWAKDERVRKFIEKHRPSLLISQDRDIKYRLRIESILGREIGKNLLIHSEGNFKIYDLLLIHE